MKYRNLPYCLCAGVLLSGALTSCSLLGLGSGSDENNLAKIDPNDPTAQPGYVPDFLQAGSLDGMGSAKKIESTVSRPIQEVFKKAQEEEGLIITDPDNPLKKIEQLDQAIKSKKSIDWETDFNTARQEAMRTQKPLLAWFADSRRSPNSNQLAVEVLSTKAFTDWAIKNVVRLRLDAIISKDDPDRYKKEDELKSLSKKFNVTGFPRVFIFSADGQLIDDLKGYIQGNQEFYFTKVRNSTEIAKKRYKETRQKLSSQGFRDWTGRNGLPTFAKLYRYTPEGQTILQEMDGNFIQTNARNLSLSDQKWIAAEKEKYEKNKQTEEQ